MITHTAGPWNSQATAGNHDYAIYSESEGKDLALVRDFHEANARLIAAAPELLAALEACIADGFLAGEVLDQASAAIARATRGTL